MSKTTPPIGITQPRGFLAAGGTFGIKASGKPDMTLIVAEVPCAVAGVFTRNSVKAAPVLVDQEHLQASGHTGRAIVCNSGNSNGSTGAQGLQDARAMCARVAQRLGCPVNQVYVCSTGIIGRLLPMAKINRGIDTLCAQLAQGPKADADAAHAIMTTDLVPKTAGTTLKLHGKTVRLAGICKGSGMIAPNMATMLVFLTTDVAIAPSVLQTALNHAIAATFNRISVDQHTSCSDTVLVMASGLAENSLIHKPSGKDYAAFVQALTRLCADLAYQIVKDGEGATKVFKVAVRGAASVAEADHVGRAIVDSPLVKCAVHGSDPNWGRIVTAAGYGCLDIQPATMTLTISPGSVPGGAYGSSEGKSPKGIVVFKHGQPTPAGLKPPAALVKIMKGKDITFTLDLGRGKAAADWLGCDLSREYVRINADYTT